MAQTSSPAAEALQTDLARAMHRGDQAAIDALHTRIERLMFAERMAARTETLS
jgi:hypothetical protein